MEVNFNCDSCGECCKNVGFNKLLPSTNNICDYLIDNKCSIYEDRPLYCRIKEYGEEFYPQYSREEWYNINYAACQMLKGKRC